MMTPRARPGNEAGQKLRNNAAVVQTNFVLAYCIPIASRASEPQVPTRTPLTIASPPSRTWPIFIER
jgi:hypothetical protein